MSGQDFWKPKLCAGDLRLGNLRAGVLESKEAQHLLYVEAWGLPTWKQRLSSQTLNWRL